MGNEVTVYENSPAPLTVADVRAQVNLIQEVMRGVMVENEHYGVIPGTGSKPSLLKAGAEKLIMTFRLVPDIEEDVIELDRGHREYRVKVRLYNINKVFLGAGVGACTTMEGKYRFRTGPVELTNNPVPKEYWNLRKENPGKAQELIGGKGFSTKKNDQGQWVIAIQGEKVEHDNPADYYNTCLKMAKKRALVDACLTVTAASDIFTQDIEDMPEVIPGAAAKEGPKPDIKELERKVEPKAKAEPATDGAKPLTKEEYADALKWLGFSKTADILKALGLENAKDITAKYPTREGLLDALAAKVGKDWRKRIDLATGEIEGKTKVVCADCGYETTDLAEYKGLRICQHCYTKRSAEAEA
ncbi:MAG: hypothetical protein PHQ43_00015 [Dehalococcoidales bacterium]|nr:hypothetical protein [Dehalococcoidales bacterium]